MLRKIKFFIPTLLFMLSSMASAAPGDLDTTFKSFKGVVTFDGGGWDYGFALALQDDGKIVVAGHSRIGANDDVLVSRCNTDGSLDTTFDTDGIQTYDGGNDDYGLAVALQDDGKIVVAGVIENVAGEDVLVLRYNTDGSLDTTFDTDGIQTYDSGNPDYGLAVALQDDGKIVVAGFIENVAGEDVLVLRYNTDGSLDTTFDTDGVQTYDSGNSDGGFAVALQDDGKIVVAGYSRIGANDDVLVLRYNIDGSLDTTFDTDGVQTYDGGGLDYGVALALQDDGKIVVAGVSDNGTNNDLVVLKYTTNGSLDTGFGNNGVATYDGGNNDYGHAVALQADGKIVAAGISSSGTDDDVLTVRFIGDAVGGGAAPPLLFGGGGGGGGGGCFIATAAYGSGMAREVKVFQRVRDEYLLTNGLGRIFVSAYYKYSPPLAHWIAEHPVVRKTVRVGLYPILELSKWFLGENPQK